MKSIVGKNFTKFEGVAEFKIDSNAAVCAIDHEGNMHLYVPDDSETVPDHVVALTAMSVYFAENFDEVMGWWDRRTTNAH